MFRVSAARVGWRAVNRRQTPEMASRAIVGGFGRAGHAPGEWTSFHSLAVDPMGNIYTSEVTGRRVQKFVPKGALQSDRVSTFLNRPHYDAVP